MKLISSWRKTSASGTWGEDYAKYELTQDEWDELSKRLEIQKPYEDSFYSLGCGWTHTRYEMAMTERVDSGRCTYYGGGNLCRDYENRIYLLEGHTGCETECHETMNEYNS